MELDETAVMADPHADASMRRLPEEERLLSRAQHDPDKDEYNALDLQEPRLNHVSWTCCVCKDFSCQFQ